MQLFKPQVTLLVGELLWLLAQIHLNPYFSWSHSRGFYKGFKSGIVLAIMGSWSGGSSSTPWLTWSMACRKNQSSDLGNIIRAKGSIDVTIWGFFSKTRSRKIQAMCKVLLASAWNLRLKLRVIPPNVDFQTLPTLNQMCCGVLKQMATCFFCFTWGPKMMLFSIILTVCQFMQINGQNTGFVVVISDNIFSSLKNKTKCLFYS